MKPMNEAVDFDLRGEYITLDALMKATGIALSGGAAKVLIGAGGVQVNGEAETRRGRKLRPGDEVACGEQRVNLFAAILVDEDEGVVGRIANAALWV